MTFGSGFKKYYKQIVDGDVLVLSTFFPKAPWMAELAMARNPIIYGLADEIYVAESAEKGGTWSGVVDGLRKSRKIYVRKPEVDENTANDLLIQKGAIAVDFNGTPLPDYKPQSIPIEPVECFDNKLIDFLKTGEFTVKEILRKLQLPWTEKKLRDFLKGRSEVETLNKKPLRFTMKDTTNKQKSLFG